MKKTWLKMLCLAIAVAPALANAQWPDKPVRALVTTSAGGMLDVVARIVAKELATETGGNVVVENKPGASGAIAAGQTLSAPADGYTLLFDTSAFPVMPLLHSTPYDPMKDFKPVMLVGAAPMMLVVPTDSSVKTLADLVARAKQEPGKLSFASAGTGLATHLAFELFEQKVGVEMIHVPYRGGAPAIADIMSGRVDSAFALMATTLPYIKSGKMRALAVSSSQRIAELPDVPTVAESAVPGFDVREWNGIFVRQDTPPEVMAALSKALTAVLAKPDVQEQLRRVGLVPSGQGPEQFATFMQNERTRWASLIKDRNIKM